MQMNGEDISRVEWVKLQEVWPHEAQHFTPWLADNLDRLGESLGIDLELIGIETLVGSFSLDIHARDMNGDRQVVIENQLGKTNHDHLGKVLTYGAGLKADVLVWVVGEFQDEHRQALDWLNQRTEIDTEFYGVVVRAMRIDNSRPAPLFEVVVRPNIIGKTGPSEPSDTGKKYQAFWQKVLGPLVDAELTNNRVSPSKSWIGLPSGTSGVFGGPNFAKAGAGRKARVDVYLGGSKDWNKGLFDLILETYKERVEEAFGGKCTWERLDNRNASRIAIDLPDRSINDSQTVSDDTARWMVQRAVWRREKVIPIIREAIEALEDRQDLRNIDEVGLDS